MRKANCIIAACVTAAMVFQMLVPAPGVLTQGASAFADTLSAVSQNATDASSDSQNAEGVDGANGEASSEGAAAGSSSAGENSSDNAQSTSSGSEAEGSSRGEAVHGGSVDADERATADEAAQNAAEEQADESADAERAATSAQIETADKLKELIENKGGTKYGQVTVNGDSVTEIEANYAAALVLVSNADPKIYQNAKIVVKGITGSTLLDLSANSIEEYEFLGLGDEDFPFKGSVEFGNGAGIALARTLFNVVELNDSNGTIAVTWKGKGADNPIIAKKIVGNGKTLNATVTIADTGDVDPSEVDAGITSALLGTVAGDLSVEASYSFSGTRKGIGISSTTDNAGLLVNTLESGKLTLKSLSGIDNAKGTPTITTSAPNGAAGGLIGCAKNGALVEVAGILDVSNLTVTATGSEGAAGGFIGRATGLNLSFAKDASVKPAQKVGGEIEGENDKVFADTTYAGGAIGYASFAREIAIESNWFSFKNTDEGDVAVELRSNKQAGGLFGCLDVTNGDVIIKGGTFKSKLAAGRDSDSSRGNYGGIAGNVCGGDGRAIHALVVQKKDDSATQIEIERAANLCYVGGVVGYQDGDQSVQKTAIVLDGADVKINGAAYAYTGNGKLGGAVGVVDKNQLLDVRDFKLSSANEIGKQNGGSAGIAGSAWRGIIKFSGTTDLSDAKFADSDWAAQLVYQNYNALIFATGSGSDEGWKFKRPTNAVKIDDIYSYGEVVRLTGNEGLSKDLINVDESTHSWKLNASKLSKTGNAYNLSTADDFAKLAITWQTFGYFSMVEGISGGSVSSLASSNIKITGTINLSGTGLTGLSKDRDDPGNNEGKTDAGGNERETSHYFSGALTGSGTISLAVGEPYGMRGNDKINSNDSSVGNGKIYRHQRLGLFSAVTSDARVDGAVTIGGTMRFENKADIDAGSLAARVVGTGDVTIFAATLSTAITFDSEATGKVVNAGGIFGSLADACNLTVGASTKAQTAISNASNAADIRVGEVAGCVAGDKAVTVDIAGLEVGADSQSDDIKIGDSSNGAKALVGGLIGFIQQGTEKRVNITGLSYKDFVMTVGVNGDPKHGAGGLLGYSWGSTEVTIGGENNSTAKYALTASGTTLNANGNMEVGGLVYAASGHWVIDSYAIDLSGATFNADSATTIGLMICRGSRPYADKDKYGAEDYVGLYLEDRAYWGEAYKIENTTISASKVKIFDEWVGNGKRESSKLIDGDWNAVVSLHTAGDSLLNMSGDSTYDNSYKNRTAIGRIHNTNGNTRYYYNLDKALTKVKSNGKTYANGTPLTTPEELLLYCAHRYASRGSTIADYVVDKDKGLLACFKGNSVVIGNSSGPLIDIDMTGYSYYPTNAQSSSSVKIQNASITFCYSSIKSEQQGNKPNNESTQHENMHLALYRTIEGGNGLTVNNATFKGTIGKACGDGDDSTSGVLGFRFVHGTSKNAVLNINISGIVLDGLRVDGADGNYAPLLINNMDKFVNLTVKEGKDGNGSRTEGISSTNAYDVSGETRTKAASSLFGKLGSTSGDYITASFANICVPGKRGGSIFSRATLLEKFEIKADGTGSASYNFYKNDAATYGKEIDAKGGEYPDLQLWYYDADLHGYDSGLVEDDGTIASKDGDNFAGYLPYVAVGNKDDNGAVSRTRHEIKVNQRVASLETGCGTYSDPYVIASADELYAVANYINSENIAPDGWRVTITRNQEAVCDRRGSVNGSKENEITYVCQSNKEWKTEDGATLNGGNSTMHRYLQSAYYSIEPKDEEGNATSTLVIDGSKFAGIGSSLNPFRGVIVGNLSTARSTESSTAVINIAGGTGDKTRGLIPYSYGSVVKDLAITYSGDPIAIAYAAKDSTNATPGSFFGGVIGCIMGGDNIVDGVSVTSSDCTLSASGDKSYLVPMGGYIGAICGGGVIFRNMEGSTNWRSSTRNTGSLYDNPYVGRVIDGYAFSEGCTVDNGNDDYQIYQLQNKGTACVETDDIVMKYSFNDDKHTGAVKVDIKNEQGLMILSAIIQSGAGAGAAHTWVGENNSVGGYSNGVYRGSRAYEGQQLTDQELNKKTYKFGNEKYGKVRNANYGSVGQSQIDETDRKTAADDDQKAPGNQVAQGPLGDENGIDNTKINSPYLVKAYANWATGYVCAMGMQGLDIEFAANKTYNMESYEAAYRGLSGCYFSNACVTSTMVKYWQYITPSIACVNGNGAIIKKVTNHVKEYKDDDYKISGVGALFNNVLFASNKKIAGSIAGNDNSNVKDLTFDTCDLSIDYIEVDKNGKQQAVETTDDSLQVGVGCFAGVVSNDATQRDYGCYKRVEIKDCEVNGGASAGGLLGNAGYAGIASSPNKINSKITSPGRNVVSPVKLTDCQYSNCKITAKSNAGGFVGKLLRVDKDDNTCALFSVDAKTGEKPSGQNSTIRATAKWGSDDVTVGGLIGLTNAEVRIGSSTDAETPVRVCNVTLTSDLPGNNAGSVLSRGIGGVVGRAEFVVSANHVLIESGDNASYFGSTNTNDDNYKFVGGIVGYGANNVSATDCKVTGIQFKTSQGAGGIIGGVQSGRAVTVENCTIDSIESDGAYSGGVLGINNGGGTLSVGNTAVKNSTFKKRRVGNNGTYSGGVSGDAKGTIRMSNIMISENSFGEGKCYGLLLGNVVNDVNGIYVAGLNVKLGANQTNDSVPGLMYCGNNAASVNKKTYIAFGDYKGANSSSTQAGTNGSLLYNDERDGSGAMPAVSAASPYVTTSPIAGNPKVKISEDADASEYSFFGDGVAIDTAATIQADAKNVGEGKETAGRYAYTNIGGCDGDGNYRDTNAYEPSSKSTFNESNPDSKAPKVVAGKNFNVLVIPGNDTTTVTNYLNLVTNGGFSDAVRLNPSVKGDSSFVTAKAEMFTLQNGAFVRSDAAASLRVVKDGTSDMSFRASTSWDNNMSRFTLLTVTFNDGAGHKYKVQVPIVVKRMLEIDFSATYAYGTNYKASAYDGLTGHVLTGMGDTMTGYLTWTYNESMGDNTVRYGLDTLLESGGSLKPVTKSIVFDGGKTAGALPVGTQLTLVDTRNNDKQYTYTVQDGDTKKTTNTDGSEYWKTSIPLTKFTDSSNPAKPYREQWLSELMGVIAEQNNNGDWVKLPEDAADEQKNNAVAKVGEGYYRLRSDGETVDAGNRYNLSLRNDNGESLEKTVSENFFLVMRVPVDSSKNVNGFTTTEVSAEGVNTHVNVVHRYDKSSDDHSNTESTYGIAASYGQVLTDNKKPGTGDSDNVVKMTLDGEGAVYKNLGFDVTDTIMLGENEYNSNDALYFQLNSSLAQFKDGGSAGAVGYPEGAAIKNLKFYVTVGDDYYAWNGSNWSKTDAGEPAVDAKNVTASGSDLSLVLSGANGEAINLQAIRDIAKGTAGKSFTIRVVADVEMTEPQCEAAIMASTDSGVNGYTKPTYRSFLSTHDNSLSTSSTAADNEGGVRYYCQGVGSSTIALIASKKTQLGINVNDLASADGTIALVGTYDMSKLSGADTKIAGANKLTYTLTLQRRQDDGSYAAITDDIGNYITVKEYDHSGEGGVALSQGGGSIVFTDGNGTGAFATRDGTSLAFKHRFVVKVNTDVEEAGQFYANYRLVLAAHLTGDDVDDTPVNPDSVANYPNSDYVTYTLTKVETKGISHGNQ